jgi:hypothetical protein
MIMFFKCCKFNVYILKYESQIMLLRNNVFIFLDNDDQKKRRNKNKLLTKTSLRLFYSIITNNP